MEAIGALPSRNVNLVLQCWKRAGFSFGRHYLKFEALQSNAIRSSAILPIRQRAPAHFLGSLSLISLMTTASRLSSSAIILVKASDG